jgi:hypothetical protein
VETDLDRKAIRTFRLRSKPTQRAKNALEAMSQRKVPDVILGLLLALLCAFTLLPYLGGRELWMLGPNTIKLPTISAFALWLSIITTPYLWLFATTRLIGAPLPRLVIEVCKATLLLVLVMALHTVYPAFGLTASDQSNLLNRQIDAHGLLISRGAIGYSFFRTEPIPLDTEGRECMLRFESARITSGLAGPTLGYLEAPPWRRVSSLQLVDQSGIERSIEEPLRSEVAGRAVLRVNAATSRVGDFPLDITYNFRTLETEVKPEAHVQKEVFQSDLVVTSTSRAVVQLVGWTLWGEGEAALTIDHPKIKIDGKRFCPPFVGSLQALKAKALKALTT